MANSGKRALVGGGLQLCSVDNAKKKQENYEYQAAKCLMVILHTIVKL